MVVSICFTNEHHWLPSNHHTGMEVCVWCKATRIARDAEQRRGAGADKQTCPACHGKKSYPINGHDAPCEWCDENGQV